MYIVAADGQHANGQLVQLSATWQAQQAALQMWLLSVWLCQLLTGQSVTMTATRRSIHMWSQTWWAACTSADQGLRYTHLYTIRRTQLQRVTFLILVTWRHTGAMLRLVLHKAEAMLQLSKQQVVLDKSQRQQVMVAMVGRWGGVPVAQQWQEAVAYRATQNLTFRKAM